MAAWITLPHAWKLQDIQAVLNVIITTLSGLTVFVITRCCWQLGARSVVRKKPVASSSLLTVSTLGEVLETLVFLDFSSIRHVKIIAQSLAVAAFSLTALLSGPIARYSTHMTQTIVLFNTNGLLTSRYDNSMATSQVAWNRTQTSLDRANFPLDQLLDYMPDTTYEWIYRPEEWNNSWSMTCDATELTPVSLVFTDDCTAFSSKLGAGGVKVFPMGVYSDYYYYAFSDYYLNSSFIKDLQIFQYAANYSNYDELSDTYQTIDMAVGSLHVHGIPKNDSNTFDPCRFGEGAATSASYNRVECHLTRSPNTEIEDKNRVAYPDCGDVDGVPSAYSDNYFERFKRESMADGAITVVSPNELIRFYQIYMVTKDTQRLQPVQREMSIQVPAVQVSTIFVAFFTFLLLFIVVGATWYVLFWFGHRSILEPVPQSKLDWLLLSITHVPVANDYVNGQPVSPGNYMQKRGRRRAQFETAVYDSAQVEQASSPVVQSVHHVIPKSG